MEAEAVLKTIDVNGETYNIGHLSSSIGSWLTMRLMKMFRQLISGLENEEPENTNQEEVEEPENFSSDLIQTLLMEADEKEFETIQRHALNVVSVTQTIGERTFNQPILLKNGNFYNKELSKDTATVLSLTSQVLFANLGPFFTRTGLKATMKGERVSSR